MHLFRSRMDLKWQERSDDQWRFKLQDGHGRNIHVTVRRGPGQFVIEVWPEHAGDEVFVKGVQVVPSPEWWPSRQVDDWLLFAPVPEFLRSLGATQRSCLLAIVGDAREARAQFSAIATNPRGHAGSPLGVLHDRLLIAQAKVNAALKILLDHDPPPEVRALRAADADQWETEHFRE
jgi:hypothetical protein